MSDKRRDNKGRILHNGEIQQKNGRYRYKYYDGYGNDAYLYSWRLDKSDATPNGKQPGPSLRELEKELQANQFKRIGGSDANMTVLELVRRYVATKTGVRSSTRAGYQTTINFLKNDPFGSRKIGSIRISDAKVWLIRLQQELGKSYSSIHNIRGVLRPAFRMALDDDLIRRNPFDFELASVVVNDMHTREAISREDERKYLKFVKEDSHFSKYYDAIFILFNTGLRISEFVGITESDIDFDNHSITVNKTLVYQKLEGDERKTYHVGPPKTKSSNRVVPMCKECEIALKKQYLQRNNIWSRDGSTIHINPDCGDLVFVTRLGAPINDQNICDNINRILDSINEMKDPLEQIQRFSSHCFRHTFATRCIEAGMKPKTLQMLLGHSNIATTQIYAETSSSDVMVSHAKYVI